MPVADLPSRFIDPAATATTERTPAISAKGDSADDPYLEIGELRKQYENYLYSKNWEIVEKRMSRRYYAGDQWTQDELKKLKARNQPKVTRNRVKRKINGVVGLVERMRQDPKCYPRGPKHDGSADVATAVIRYVLDANRWESLSSKCAADAAREGLAVLELGIKQKPEGDFDITLNRVSTDSYFYDPRSYEYDFSDVLYNGTAKWVDTEIAKTFCPKEKWSQLEATASSDNGAAYSEDGERAIRWMDSARKRVRLVDHWYFKNGQWCWCLYTYGLKLMEGISTFSDIDGKTISKYLAFSANVDPDGDRYGFIRDMKDIQDEINHRYSKALHLLNARRTLVRRGTMDVNKLRTESQKPDGVIEWDSEKPEFDDAKAQNDMVGQLKFLEDAKTEIENFGPNPALMGQGDQGKSGRAIALLQQAGIAELGPYIIEYKDWKLRIYRAVFAACKKHWTLERWIRVTDPDDQQQMLQINGLRYDPLTLQPQTINSLACIDVDIIIDEGADTINMMQDTFDTLGVLASRGAEVPPGLLIELSPIAPAIKKKWLEKMDQGNQPDPQREEAKKIALEGEEAKVAKTKSEVIKNMMTAVAQIPQPAAVQMQPGMVSLEEYLEHDSDEVGPMDHAMFGQPPQPGAQPGNGAAQPPGGVPLKPTPAPPPDMAAGLAPVGGAPG